MKNKIILVIIKIYFFINFDLTYCQVTKLAPFIFGIESGGQLLVPYKPGNGFPTAYDLMFKPFMNFKIVDNFYLGASYSYEFGKYNNIRTPTLNAIGPQALIILNPFYKKSNYSNRFLFEFQLQYMLSDYYPDSQQQFGIKKTDLFDSGYFDVSLTCDFNMYKSIYLNFGYQYLYYTYNNKFRKSPKLALQYHFGERRIKNIKPKEKENKSIGIFDFHYLLRENFLDFCSINFTYSYIFDNSVENEIMTLSSVNLALKTALLEGLEIGYSYSLLFQKNNEQREQFFLHGPFIDINLFKTKNINRGFLSSGFYFGNYNMCTDGNPEKKDGLRYVRLGFGYEHKFFIKNLFFKFHADKYLAVNCGTESSSYLFPFAGFSYYIENK
jgi:hypothetical protein